MVEGAGLEIRSHFNRPPGPAHVELLLDCEAPGFSRPGAFLLSVVRSVHEWTGKPGEGVTKGSQPSCPTEEVAKWHTRPFEPACVSSPWVVQTHIAHSIHRLAWGVVKRSRAVFSVSSRLRVVASA